MNTAESSSRIDAVTSGQIRSDVREITVPPRYSPDEMSVDNDAALHIWLMEIDAENRVVLQRGTARSETLRISECTVIPRGVPFRIINFSSMQVCLFVQRLLCRQNRQLDSADSAQ